MTDLFYVLTSDGPVLTVGGMPLGDFARAEQALDEGADFFAVQGELASKRLEGVA